MPFGLISCSSLRQILRIPLSQGKFITPQGKFLIEAIKSPQKRHYCKVIFPLRRTNPEYFETESNVPDDFRHAYADFIPNPFHEKRNRLREKIEREEMIARRGVIDIPEFYAGSIVAVTLSDPNASGKVNKFVGICQIRGGTGLRSFFVLRNFVDNLGIEILYELYCPLLLSIEVLRLEKRLDDDLMYLRDALPEYYTIPFNMEVEPFPDGVPVPVNPIKVKLKLPPWYHKWDIYDRKGMELPRLPYRHSLLAKKHQKPWEKYDLMKEYRATIPEEEQAYIYKELAPHMPRFEAARRKVKKIRLQ